MAFPTGFIPPCHLKIGCGPGGAHRGGRGGGGGVLSPRSEHAPAEIRYNGAALVVSSWTTRRDRNLGYSVGTDSK